MTNRTRTAFSIVLALPAIVFVLTGLRWWVDPTAAADQLGMPLLSGLGLSSQVGDLAAFFLMMGLFVLVTEPPHDIYAEPRFETDHAGSNSGAAISCG